MRFLSYMIIFIIGLVLWVIGVTVLTFMALLCVLGDIVLPNRTWGNCWIYALPLFVKHGGYLLIRRSDGQKFLRIFPVLHIIWVARLSKDNVISQYLPPEKERRYGRFVPVHTVVYHGEIVSTEKDHNVEDWLPDSLKQRP